jgi:hypothetical protein
MRFNQRNLGREFLFGEKSGKASNVEIENFPGLGMTALIGYGHAVYATRDTATGTVTYYEGWWSKSVSTRTQLTKMGLSRNATDHDRNVDHVIDERKGRGELRRADKEARREKVAP